MLDTLEGRDRQNLRQRKVAGILSPIAPLFASLCLFLGISTLTPARAQSDPAERAFKMLTSPMNPSRRVQFCAYVAKDAEIVAGEAPDASVRSNRAIEALSLQARLAKRLEAANAKLSAEELRNLETENAKAVAILSYLPSPTLDEGLKADREDTLGLFMFDIVKRCNGMLDKMGVAQSDVTPTASVPAFRWRGETSERLFADTSLSPFAAQICIGAESAAADFTGAQLSERGESGLSLLDWAMACRDRAAYVALLDAGFDATTAGAFEDPPLVGAAGKADTWYLRQLLDRGVPADAMGHIRTALAEAFSTDVVGGGEAFELLRAAGASLNFPNFEDSMWSAWSNYAGWSEILRHWPEFESDAVKLGRTVTFELEGRDVRGDDELMEIKQRLMADYGVCFPVNATMGWEKDTRGFLIQPGCLK